MLTSRHRLGYLCKNNKYDQAKYFLDIYSDSAEMSVEKSIFVYLLFIADEPDDVFFYWTESPDRPWARELNEGHKKCRWHGLTDEFMPCYKD